jgi:heme exporter protein C
VNRLDLPPEHTGSPRSRVLGWATIVAMVALALFGLVFSPPAEDFSDSVRLMYLHVPTAILAFVCFFVTAFGGVMWLWKRSVWWDLVAASSAEIGVVFTGLTLVLGMLWGKPIWGAYWVWDARLTTTALLFLLYVGYLAVRRLPAEPDVRRRRSAWVGIIAAIDIPIVHWSVDWWQGLHQNDTISRLDPTIDGLMLFTLMLGMVAFALLYLWLMVHRFRLAWLEEQAEAAFLEQALTERRAEAGPGEPREPIDTPDSTEIPV